MLRALILVDIARVVHGAGRSESRVLAARSVRGAGAGAHARVCVAPSEQAAARQPRRGLALLLVGTDLVRARPRARWVTRLLDTQLYN